MEAVMNRSNAIVKAIPLLIGAALALSACAAGPGYVSSGYAYDYGYPVYGYPAYGSLQFDYWSGWHRWDHYPYDHGWHGGHH
jgi:hypothetical protein